jgi:hypothetical protein
VEPTAEGGGVPTDGGDVAGTTVGTAVGWGVLSECGVLSGCGVLVWGAGLVGAVAAGDVAGAVDEKMGCTVPLTGAWYGGLTSR